MRLRERIIFRYAAKRNIHVVHAPIDWRSGESFESLLRRMAKLAQAQLAEHGKLTLVGVSAGGSLAVNILNKLHDPNLSVITLCSRLHEVPLKWWDRRNLTRMAHIGTRNQSQAFFDSVMHCTNTTIPRLTANDKTRIVITRQWADFIVPRQTMDIPGVQIYKVPGLGHGWGIVMGMLQLSRIVKILT